MTDPTPTDLSPTAVESAAAYADSWLGYRQRYLRVPGVQAAVLFGDRVVLSSAYGMADVESAVPMTVEHLFRVASHSKTFTATAVMQLVQAGRLRLDDPVGSWLPSLVDAGGPAAGLTVRELLSHSSGLVRDGRDGDFWQLLAPFPDAAALHVAATADATVIPVNERFKYSNIAYGLLGLVIEAVSGRTYADYVTTEIVDALGLRDTGPELDPALADRYATGYSSLAYAADRQRIEHVDTAALAAATGFYSTASDLCRYAAAHFPGNSQLLDDSAKRVMQHAWWPVEGTTDGAYGLGFSIVTSEGRRLVGHGGGYPGHITRTVFDPEERLAVSVLTNAIDGPAEDLALTVVKLIDLAAADERPLAPGVSRFCGRFANLWGVRDVARLGGRLVLLDPTSGSPTESCSELEVEGSTTLRVAKGPGYGAVGERMEFTFGPDGAIASVRGAGGLTWWPLETYQLRR